MRTEEETQSIKTLSTNARKVICDVIKDSQVIDYAGLTRQISIQLFGKTPSEMREARPTDSGALATSARDVMTERELVQVCMAESLIACLLKYEGHLVSPLAIAEKACEQVKGLINNETLPSES